jgi:hypothetical protein
MTYPRRSLLFVSLGVALLTARCSGDESSGDSGRAVLDSGADSVTDAPRAATEAGPDAASEAAAETGADTGPDAPADTSDGSPSATAVVIASDVQNPFQIVVGGGNVVWTDSIPLDGGAVLGRVMTMPVAGGTETTIATTPPNVLPEALVLDSAATTVYWITHSPDLCLNATPLAGGATRPMTCFVAEDGIAIDGTNAYFVAAVLNAPTKIALGIVDDAGRVDLGTQLTQPIASGASPVDLALAGGNLYWITNAGTIQTVSAAVSLQVIPTTIVTPDADAGRGQYASGDLWEGLTTDGTNLYWPRYVAAQIGSATGAVLKVPLAGGTPVTLYDTGLANAYSVTTDGTSVYWIEQNAAMVTLRKIAVSGGPVATLRVQLGLAAGQLPSAWGTIAIDTTSVYVLDPPTIWRVSK